MEAACWAAGVAIDNDTRHDMRFGCNCLQAPMYARLVPLLLRHASFPADFTSWQECISIDEEVFSRFR